MLRRSDDADTPRESAGLEPGSDVLDCMPLGWKKMPAGRPSGLWITMPLAADPPILAAVSLKYSSASAGMGLLTGSDLVGLAADEGDDELAAAEPGCVLFCVEVASAPAGAVLSTPFLPDLCEAAESGVVLAVVGAAGVEAGAPRTGSLVVSTLCVVCAPAL